MPSVEASESPFFGCPSQATRPLPASSVVRFVRGQCPRMCPRSLARFPSYQMAFQMLFLLVFATGTALAVFYRQGWMTNLLSETPMNTLSSKLTTFAAALAMNSLIMGALGFLFELQSHPHLSVISFARNVATHQWLI